MRDQLWAPIVVAAKNEAEVGEEEEVDEADLEGYDKDPVDLSPPSPTTDWVQLT